MDIRKAKENFNKDGKPKYFNLWTYGKRLQMLGVVCTRR